MDILHPSFKNPNEAPVKSKLNYPKLLEIRQIKFPMGGNFDPVIGQMDLTTAT